MMKLGFFQGATVALAASALSVVAAAQTGGGQSGLNIPANPQFVGKQDPNVRKAAAIVNGEVITGTDIDHRAALYLDSLQPGLSREQIRAVLASEEAQPLYRRVISDLIDEALKIQAARQQEITIEPREVDGYFARFANGLNMTPDSFAAHLRGIGSSDRSLKRQFQADLAWQRLQRRRIEPFVSVGDEEVEDILQRLNESRGTAEYRVSEIFISSTPETAAEARANAAGIVQQIRGGAPFAAYARQFSEASTAAVGGDLGWVRIEQLPEELAALVREMPVGAITDPIPVPGGFSILVLTDSRQILVADPRDAVHSVLQMTISLPPGTTRQQAEPVLERLTRATQSMGGCGRAQETARTLGAELVSNDRVVPRDDLPPVLQQMVLNLNVGEATPPFGSLESISVLILCGRDDPAASGEPSFDAVYSQLSEERIGRRAQRYLRDLRRDAVIDYR
jgi:peptidyl-prolyl cis-trans isomerase SurA